MDRILQLVFLGAMLFFFLIAVTIFISCCRRRRNKQIHTKTQKPTSANSHILPVSIGNSFDRALNRISMAELLAATQNFSEDLIIGGGTFGLVYKAKLSNGSTVAVKKIGPYAFQGFHEFQAEMETLGKIRHPNIVKLLGYCDSGAHRVLIHEFMEKGRLDQWLYYEMGETLSWDTRINIVKGVAKGLCHLHSLKEPIIHRDIKPSNVLLNSNFEAHVADFGLARCVDQLRSQVSTDAGGTLEYMPPEYRDGLRIATVKGDVYSFGILMLEIANGKRPNQRFLYNGWEELEIAEWTGKMVFEKREIEMIDARISRDELKEEQIVEFMRIAILCTSTRLKDRPAMQEVVKWFEGTQFQ